MDITQINEQHVLISINQPASKKTTARLIAILTSLTKVNDINIIDYTLGFNHLLLCIEDSINLKQIKRLSQSALTQITSTKTINKHYFPVCYELGDDIQCVLKQTGLNLQTLIRLHTKNAYQVYTLGFMPGFAYLGDTPMALQIKRKIKPRTQVPLGSVAIAGQFTAIYPFASPGGWHIIGRCPSPPDPLNHKLSPFDEVNFFAISTEEYEVQSSRSRGDNG